MMDTTPPDVTDVPHVHGMQIRDLPGFYNSSCGPFTDSTCITQLNLWCVDGVCQCIDNFVPDGSGGCQADIITLMVMCIIRLFVCVSIFIICLFGFHMIVSKRCCKRTSSMGGAEGEAEEGRRGSRDSCWDDEPPSYLEVAEETPPPTYLEAVAKEGMCDEAATRGDMDRTPPQLVPARGEEGGLETSTISPQPLPSPPDPTPPLALHM